MSTLLTTGVMRFNLVPVAVVTASLLALWLHFRQRTPKGLRLPPGPPGKLIIGNLFDMPTQQEWVTFSEWSKTYGDLVYLKIFGKSILVINSAHITYELFEKRSSIYSDRGEMPMITDLMGCDWAIGFMRYGDLWRSQRRAIHQKFHPVAAAEFQPIQLTHTRGLLRRLYETPDDFMEHLRHTSAAIIMEIVYAIKVLPKDDPYITAAEKVAAAAAIAGTPGTFLIDVFPILKYVPGWFPGAGFQRKAKEWRKHTVEMNVAPFEAVKRALSTGTAEPSFISTLLEELSVKGIGKETVIRGAGSSLYAAGADSVLLALHVFFLAMVLFPEAQRKAQEELDEVVGSKRLPDYEDRKSLPYINALCKEVLRWHPILPFGVAHRVTQDDVFGGYFIPAGTLVIGNTWKLLHDEATYGTDADKFRPERFLTPGMKDPDATFGYGRRICPGRYFASNSIFIAVASILSVFDISPARDSSGKEIPIEAIFKSGFVSGPVSFNCAIFPRSDATKKLVPQV